MQGIDTEAGLATVQNNHKLYVRLLHKYHDSQKGFVSDFRDALDKGDQELATRLAHTLKGVSGNIGAQAVQEAARKLESLCKKGLSGKKIESMLTEVESTLATVIAAIEGLAPAQADETDTVAHAIDMHRVEPIIRELGRLLQENDTDAADSLEELEQLLGTAQYRPLIGKLEAAISSYDFEEAQDQLKVLCGRLNLDTAFVDEQ